MDDETHVPEWWSVLRHTTAPERAICLQCCEVEGLPESEAILWRVGAEWRHNNADYDGEHIPSPYQESIV